MLTTALVLLCIYLLKGLSVASLALSYPCMCLLNYDAVCLLNRYLRLSLIGRKSHIIENSISTFYSFVNTQQPKKFPEFPTALIKYLHLYLSKTPQIRGSGHGGAMLNGKKRQSSPPSNH